MPLKEYFLDFDSISDTESDRSEVTHSEFIPQSTSANTSSRYPILSSSSQPSTSSPSPSASPETIGARYTARPLAPLVLAMGLYFEKSGESREDYRRLREILQLLSTPPFTPVDMTSLPRKLDTLKKQIRQHLPMLKLMRKAIMVSVEKQASFPAQQKKTSFIINRLS